ncbi:hypothetical protein Prum_012410 [Phytohabitans rumicis]|uniref:MalT-like TPR region domain-containing protein n=2 Tax=Phytohabitans rumicis TaxID=1076125 RepID=A0A6V8KZ49_9ACTN|nr:hypothetical protein Prum_012410 [Phytohabitans rumicis]
MAVRHWFVAELIPQLCLAVPDLKIVLAGREDVRIPTSIEVRSVELTEWTREDSRAYLRRRGIDAAGVADAIYDYCRGVPVWTSLMADLQQERGEDISEAWLAAASRNRLAGEWLPQEFLRRLAADRRAVVLAAATLRSVRKEAIEFMLADDVALTDPHWYADFLEQSFVRTSYGVDGGRDNRVHELVRVAVLEYLSHDEPTKLDLLHHRAAHYFAAQGAFLEETYHRFAAGDMSLAVLWSDRVRSALETYKVGSVLALTSVLLAPEVVGRLARTAPEIVGHAEQAAGRIAFHQGHLPEAAQLLANAIGRLDGNDATWRAATLELLGDIAVRVGDLDQAERHYRAELEVAERLGQVEERMGALVSLGDIARRQRRVEQATTLYEEALEIARLHGHHLRYGKTLRSLGRVALQQGDLKVAEERFRAALSQLEKAGDLLERARTLNALGELHSGQRTYGQALAWLEQALALCRSVGSPHHEANTLVLYADALIGLGELERAAEHYDAALQIFDRTGGLLGRARVLRGLGDAAIGQREAAVAAEWYGQAIEAYRRVDGRLGEARAAYSRWFAMAKINAVGLKEAETTAERLLTESRSEDLRRRVATYVQNLWATGCGPQPQT